MIDSENALDETWLHALGVDTDESKLLKLSMSMIDDVAKTISTFMKDYKAMAEEECIKLSQGIVCNRQFRYVTNLMKHGYMTLINLTKVI